MTTQSSERFENSHPAFRTGEWRVFAVIRGAPSKENHGWGERDAEGRLASVYKAEPGDAPWQTSGNWKGYTCVFRLAPDGRMTLLRFEYDDRTIPTRVVNERLEGDFYLVLKAVFEGPRLYVPFRDGSIVLDRGAWLHEQYTGPSPVATELRPGCHPDFPGRPRLWYE